MPEETCASFRIDYHKGNGQPAQATVLSDKDIQNLDEKLRKIFPDVIGPERVLMWNGTQNAIVAGQPASTTHYLRSGPKGPVMVWVHNVALPNGDFLMIDCAMRAGEADLWEAVLKKCIGSLTIEKTPGVEKEPRLCFTGDKPHFRLEFPEGWHSPRELPGKLGFAQFRNRTMTMIVESTTDTSTFLEALLEIMRKQPRFQFESVVAARPDSIFIESQETKVSLQDAVETSFYYYLNTKAGPQKIYCCITTTIVGHETFVAAFECLPADIDEGRLLMRDALDGLKFNP